jgi:hypothetical protein
MGHGIIFSSGQRTPLSLVCGGSLAAAAVSWAAVAIGSKVMRRGLPENQDGNRDGDPVASKTKSENVEGEEGEPIPTIPGCPVGSSAKDASRVVRLYEAYIHLDGLRGKWECPFTSNPVLEPSFVAAMHGLELSFLLLANFLEDSRAYIVMQHRIELAAKDVSRSKQLSTLLQDSNRSSFPTVSTYFQLQGLQQQNANSEETSLSNVMQLSPADCKPGPATRRHRRHGAYPTRSRR